MDYVIALLLIFGFFIYLAIKDGFIDGIRAERAALTSEEESRLSNLEEIGFEYLDNSDKREYKKLKEKQALAEHLTEVFRIKRRRY